MPAKAIYHDTVKNALVKDGWTITHDPLRLKWGSNILYVDLGAERLLTAEKANRKIAVEVKSFVSHSNLADLENALGQYILYRDIIEELEPDRVLYLAVHEEVFETIFQESLGQMLIRKNQLKLIIFNKTEEVIVKWNT
ncbi:fatty-acid synthase [Candidatus Poribacteria bacterium]|nr:MAG: fatty-acid synthase [Candidatus Poribacteria bacterium]